MRFKQFLPTFSVALLIGLAGATNYAWAVPQQDVNQEQSADVSASVSASDGVAEDKQAGVLTNDMAEKPAGTSSRDIKPKSFDEAPKSNPDAKNPVNKPQAQEQSKWVQDKKGWRYVSSNASYPASCFKEIEGKTYYFDAQGYRVYDWQKIEGTWYYFDDSGVRASGWKYINRKWYYFGEQGALKTGWIKSYDLWYYSNSSGEMQTGWLRWNNNLYYLSDTGAMATGWKYISGKWYYFDEQGALKTGWIKSHDLWYYCDGSGVMKTGWLRWSNKLYYLSDTGAMATGWKQIAGKWYYFDNQGIVKTGWVFLSDYWYYLDGSGVMKTGWVSTNGNYYYMNSNGQMITGWKMIDRVWYYFDKPSGHMYKGTHTIDGKRYSFDARGAWVDPSNNYAVRNLAFARTLSSKTNYLILVDTQNCHTMIYHWEHGTWVPLYDWLCSPGAYRTPTVKGSYTINSKGLSFGRGFTCWYWSSFYGDYLFHSVTYYPGSKSHIMEGKLGVHISHGCVRLDIKNAKWIYDNIPIGTKVYIW